MAIEENAQVNVPNGLRHGLHRLLHALTEGY